MYRSKSSSLLHTFAVVSSADATFIRKPRIDSLSDLFSRNSTDLEANVHVLDDEDRLGVVNVARYRPSEGLPLRLKMDGVCEKIERHRGEQELNNGRIRSLWNDRLLLAAIFASKSYTCRRDNSKQSIHTVYLTLVAANAGVLLLP
eukprot:Gb_07478 [translate_table: standard]